ncbi:MAG: hypothetical protein MR902_00005, partial [Campylobacter sp.]|nr:hypothetical protein [Campylobacter sp.]
MNKIFKTKFKKGDKCVVVSEKASVRTKTKSSITFNSFVRLNELLSKVSTKLIKPPLSLVAVLAMFCVSANANANANANDVYVYYTDKDNQTIIPPLQKIGDKYYDYRGGKLVITKNNDVFYDDYTDPNTNNRYYTKADGTPMMEIGSTGEFFSLEKIDLGSHGYDYYKLSQDGGIYFKEKGKVSQPTKDTAIKTNITKDEHGNLTFYDPTTKKTYVELSGSAPKGSVTGGSKGSIIFMPLTDNSQIKLGSKVEKLSKNDEKYNLVQDDKYYVVNALGYPVYISDNGWFYNSDTLDNYGNGDLKNRVDHETGELLDGEISFSNWTGAGSYGGGSYSFDGNYKMLDYNKKLNKAEIDSKLKAYNGEKPNRMNILNYDGSHTTPIRLGNVKDAINADEAVTLGQLGSYLGLKKDDNYSAPENGWGGLGTDNGKDINTALTYLKANSGASIDFITNKGEVKPSSGKVTIKGDDYNTEPNDFDEGKNVFVYNDKDINDQDIIRVAISKNPKFDSVEAFNLDDGVSTKLTPEGIILSGYDEGSVKKLSTTTITAADGKIKYEYVSENNGEINGALATTDDLDNKADKSLSNITQDGKDVITNLASTQITNTLGDGKLKIGGDDGTGSVAL